MNGNTKPRNVQRSAGIIARHAGWFLLHITHKTKRTERTDYYLGHELSSGNFGRGFVLNKQDEAGTVESYQVNLDSERSNCECRGFVNHGICKHIEALTALVKAGQLPAVLPGEATIPTGD